MRESYEGEPPESIRQKTAGSTTFVQCGWCKHAGSGSHRFNYMIHGYCDLVDSFRDQKELKWDSKCLLQNVSKSEIGTMISHHKYTIENARSTIKNRKEYIIALRERAETAKYAPPLAEDRHADHFNTGDKIAIWMGEIETKSKKKIKINEWFAGEVKPGYRHHDGAVSYRIDNIGPQNDSFWGCGIYYAGVMLMSEYEWFAQNPKEFKEWIEKSKEKAYNKPANPIDPPKKETTSQKAARLLKAEVWNKSLGS